MNNSRKSKFSLEYIHLYDTKGISCVRCVLLAIACGICFWVVVPITPVELRMSAGSYFVYAMPLCCDYYYRAAVQPSRYGKNKVILTTLAVLTTVSAIFAFVVSFSPNLSENSFLFNRGCATFFLIINAIDAISFLLFDYTDAIEPELSDFDKERQEKFKEMGSIPPVGKGENKK